MLRGMYRDKNGFPTSKPSIDVPAFGDDTKAVAEWLGVVLTDTPSGTLCGICPLHVDSNPSFHVYVEGERDNGFFCFGCGQGGDASKLLSLAKEISYQEAYVLLHDGFTPILRLLQGNGRAGSWVNIDEEYLNLYARVNVGLRILDAHYTAHYMKGLKDTLNVVLGLIRELSKGDSKRSSSDRVDSG
jgi:hypothetical protein